MGLVIFAAIGIYLLISIAVVMGAIKYAQRSERNPRYWAWGAILLMYLIPFWDLIPTIATHQFHCATSSDFWAYKTVKQWNAENPGVMETLSYRKDSPSTVDKGPERFVITIVMNDRFNLLLGRTPQAVYGWKWVHEIVDSKTGTLLAKRIDFSTGNGLIGGEPELRFWLHSNGCPKQDKQVNLF